MDKKMMDMYLRGIVEKSATGNNESVAADGGNTLGLEISLEIFNRMISTSTILGQAQIVRMGKGLTVKVPYLNDYLSVNEGETAIRAYWIDEAADKTANIPQLGYVKLTLGKLVVRIPFTDELWNDRIDLVDWLITNAADSIKNKLEYAMIYGTGAVKGIASGDTDGEKATVKSGFAIAGTITEANLVAAFKLLNPLAINGARWYVSQDVYANLNSYNYDVITRDADKMYILGLEVEVCPWLDASLPIFVGNFACYCIAEKETQVKVGDQIRFLYDESELRMVYRVAGEPITEVQTIDSTDKGWFVTPDPTIS